MGAYAGPVFRAAQEIFAAGGWVMYPLLLLSLVSVTIIFERTMFWMRVHGPRGMAQLAQLRKAAAGGDRQALLAAATRGGPYGVFVSDGVTGAKVTEAGLHDAAEHARPAIERFGGILSAIVTAAPMLGILGTVVGIIGSFQLLGSDEPITDPAVVAEGIATALYTTAAGLVVSLATLFPMVAFRVQSDRCLNRIEALAGQILESSKGV